MTDYPVREGDVTVGGYPMDVRGAKVSIGQPAPDFKLVAPDWSRKRLSDFSGKVKVLSILPSLDTEVCDLQARHFNTAAADLGDNGIILNISADLPFAIGRWQRENEIDGIVFLSTHKDMQFSDDYGTHVLPSRTNQRAVIVLDADDNVVYAEYVTEQDDGVNIPAAMEAAKAAIGKKS